MINWQMIILHHSLTEDNKTVNWGAIRKYHKELGWQDIGYHFGVELVNDDYEILLGRQLSIPGAHTQGMNNVAIGICCVGNYDMIRPAESLLKKTGDLVANLVMQFNIPYDNIKAHRDYVTYKTCPGAQFSMPMFKARFVKPVLESLGYAFKMR